MNRKIAILASSVVVGLPSASLAQAADLFGRDRNISVKDRPRPELEAEGIHAGAFFVYPRLEVNAGYESNIFASDEDEQSDTVVQISPEIEIASDWAVHSWTASAQAAWTRYQDFATENTETASIGTTGRLDVHRQFQLGGGAEWARRVEPRTASNTPPSTAEPIRYDQTSLHATAVHTFNRLQVSGRADRRDFTYEDGRSPAGAVIDQSDRNHTTWELAAQASYAVSPATALFVSVAADDRDYGAAGPTQAPVRDSKGVRALAGADFELTDLVRGDVAIGYVSQSFDDPAYEDISGVSGRARLEYFISSLVTLGLVADRSVGDSGIAGSAGFLSTSVAVSVDYELRRNVIVEARLGWTREDFDTIDREDDRLQYGVRATYFVNKRLGVTASYDFENRHSRGVDSINDFATSRLNISLVAQI